MRQFTDKADFKIRFQPFQLYPDLPRLHAEGVDKKEFFKQLSRQRNPEADEEAQAMRFAFLQGEWKKDGLNLSGRGGQLGNSFDAQRLISFARKQGREDQMIEAIYTANHENNLCLSNPAVLLACADQAGIEGAEEMLNSNQELDEVFSKIQMYRAMGISSVPVLVFNDKYPIHGAPERRHLEVALRDLIEKGDNVEWPPKAPPLMALHEFVTAARTVISTATDNERSKWSTSKLDWSDGDPRWSLLEERILKNSNIQKTFGSDFPELQQLLKKDVNSQWDAVTCSKDLAFGRPVQASSNKSQERLASLAVDGNSDTRWTSVYQDEQWLAVDLGTDFELSCVEICWEAAHAERYLLQGSQDGSTWTTWTSETGHEGWVRTPLPPGCKARWVRMFGEKRATQFGFSIWEFRVFALEGMEHV